jgi:hypothetical protein
MQTGNPLHVGYKLHVTPDIRLALAQFVADENLATSIDTHPVIAAHHRHAPLGTAQSKEELRMLRDWYNVHRKKPTVAYLRGIFVDPEKKYVVGHVTLNSTQDWVVLHKGTNMTALNIRRMVSRGMLGTEIPITRISIKATAYMVETPR